MLPIPLSRVGGDSRTDFTWHSGMSFDDDSALQMHSGAGVHGQQLAGRIIAIATTYIRTIHEPDTFH